MPLRLAESEQEAARLTAAAQESAHVAARLLVTGFDQVPLINSLGIYTNPTTRRAELIAAREAIGRAIISVEGLLPPSQARPQAARVALLGRPRDSDRFG